MNNLTPRLASELAEFAYQTRTQAANNLFGFTVEAEKTISQHFAFDTKNKVVNGVSGGVICRAINLESGFVYIGTGKGIYAKDIAITFRGTDNRIRDALTDASISTITSDNGSAAHMGFVRTFQSIKPKLKKTIDEAIPTLQQ